MNKWIFSFVLFCMTIWSAQAQFVLSYSSDTLAAPNGSLDIDVVVESGFEDLLSFQFSVNWDASVFTYSSIQDVTEDLLGFSDGSIGAPPDGPGIKDGELRVSWNTQNGDPFNLPDSTKLFTLRLFGQGDLCESTTVTTSNDPLRIEVIDNDLNEVDLVDSGGSIAIYDESCVGMMGPEVLLNVSDVSAMAGSNICIPITTSNFDNIGSLQAGISWDPTVVEFTEIMDGGITGVQGNDTNADNGELVILWLFDQAAITLPDGATLFELCFNVIGDINESTTINFIDVGQTTIEIADIDGNAQDFEISSGTLTVEPDGIEEGVGLIFPEIYTDNASSICVPITTRDFNDIAGMQTGVTFDPNVLTYTMVNSVGIPGVTIGAGDAADGELRVVWILPPGSEPITLPDDAVLFELCFDVIGNEGDISSINFSGNLGFLPIEVLNPDAMELDFFVRNGSVTVGIEPGAEFTLIGGDVSGITGDTVCVPVSARRFNDIEGMGFAHQWDPQLLRYIGQQEFVLPNFGDSNFTLDNVGSLFILWTPTSAQSLADDATIYEVCFEILGDCSENIVVSVNFTDANTPLEIVGDGRVLDTELDHGSVSIGDCDGKSVNILSISNPTCSGDSDGGVQVDFNNTVGAVSCTWVDENGNQISDNCNLTGVVGGDYILSAVDGDGDTIIRTVPVIDPGVIEITPVVMNVTCDEPDGSLSLDITGGTGDYSYLWTGGLPDQGSHSPISEGTYMVTVTDANSCTSTASATIENSSFDLNPVITASTNADLNNGAIDLNPAATVDATFTWSHGPTGPSIMDLSPGTYTVTIEDNNSDCSTMKTYEVPDDSEGLSIDQIVDDATMRYNGFGVSCSQGIDGVISGAIQGFCTSGDPTATLNGAAITVGSDGSINETGLSEGDYVLEVTDACDTMVSLTITITAPEPLAASAVENVMCPDDGQSNGSIQVPVSGGVGALTYMVAVGTPGSDGTISGLPNASLVIVVEDENGCQLMIPETNYFAGQCIGPVTECIGQSIISPNSDNVNDAFVVVCDDESSDLPNTLSIYDRWGNEVFQGTNYNNTWAGTDLEGTLLPEGGYMWVLVTGAGAQRSITRGTVSILR